MRIGTNKLVRTRDTIIDGLTETVQPHLKAIRELDPDALVGTRGSLVRGFKGPHKGNAPFDPNDFDIDAFIVSDKLASQFSKRTRFRNGGNIPEIKSVQDAIESPLRQNELFSGLRTTTTTKAGKVLPDNFTFRVFTQKEMQKIIQQQDPQLYFIP